MARLSSRDCGGPASDGHDPLARHVRALGRQAEQVVEVRVGAEVLAVARGVGPVHVDQRGVERAGAGIGRRAPPRAVRVGVRRADRAQLRVDLEHAGAEPGPDRQERQPVRGGEQAPVQHALVEFGQLDRPGLPGPPEVRLEGDRVQRREAGDDPLGLAGRDQQPDVRARVGHDREVPQRRSQDGADQRHRLAPRSPAADPDRHAVAKLGDDQSVRASRGRLRSTARPLARPRRSFLLVHEGACALPRVPARRPGSARR